MIGEAMRQATHGELAKAESDAGAMLAAWMQAFVHFPTSANFDGVVERLRKYQDAWMNGRERPDE